MPRKLTGTLADAMLGGIPIPISQLVLLPPTQIFMYGYASLEGTREATGRNDGLIVEEIQKTVGLSKGDSWCMAAAQAAIRLAENLSKKISPVYASGHCLTVMRKSIGAQIPLSKKPAEGDIIIFQHGDTESGHCEGIIKLAPPKIAFTMGGNTSGNPGVDRDGNGVFFKMRDLGQTTGAMHIVGYVRPFP